MHSRDPDFPDPRAQTRWVADSLRGRYVFIPDAKHYPQSLGHWTSPLDQ